jgi:hypothetical protein
MHTIAAAVVLAATAAVLLTTQSANAQIPTTNTCYFLRGPKLGTTQEFPSAPSIPLGAPCQDGLRSSGIGTPDAVSDPTGTFTMSGRTPQCTDILGTSVTYESAPPGQPKTGLSTIINGRPVILIKRAELATFPAPLTSFLYAHECGHHALGQIVGYRNARIPIDRDGELRADCFAVKQLADVLSSDQMDTVYDFLRHLAGDAVDYPGPTRVSKLQSSC